MIFRVPKFHKNHKFTVISWFATKVQSDLFLICKYVCWIHKTWIDLSLFSFFVCSVSVTITKHNFIYTDMIIVLNSDTTWSWLGTNIEWRSSVRVCIAVYFYIFTKSARLHFGVSCTQLHYFLNERNIKLYQLGINIYLKMCRNFPEWLSQHSQLVAKERTKKRKRISNKKKTFLFTFLFSYNICNLLLEHKFKCIIFFMRPTD